MNKEVSWSSHFKKMKDVAQRKDTVIIQLIVMPAHWVAGMMGGSYEGLIGGVGGRMMDGVRGQ